MSGALYDGVVRHARLRPRRHRLSYRIPMLLLDLDRLEELFARVRLLRRGRFGLLSFREEDHLEPGPGSLSERARALLRAHGASGGGRIRLLAMPRVMGSVFNPLSVYFCEDRDGDLEAVIYEVNNTFGERRAYLLPAAGGGLVAHGCEKTFYVSPFNDLDMSYAFRVRPPSTAAAGEPLTLSILASDAEGTVLTASFAGRAQPLDDRALARTLARHPFLAAKVLLAIHVEALVLWLKGTPLTRKPDPPAAFVSPPASSART